MFAGVPLKDLDLERQLFLPRQRCDRFKSSLRRDALFLQSHGLMDYSLLLGINNKNQMDSIKWEHNSLFNVGESIGLSTPSSVTDEVLRLGIIDYLVPWGLTKKLESAVKGLTQEKVRFTIF